MRAATPLLTAGLVLGACGPSPSMTTLAAPSQKEAEPSSIVTDSTRVTAFSVDVENLNVDKIAMRDGGIRPDGNRDFVFRATVEGPADALYLVTVNEKGEPH